jgi:hypothetical protein
MYVVAGTDYTAFVGLPVATTNRVVQTSAANCTTYSFLMLNAWEINYIKQHTNEQTDNHTVSYEMPPSLAETEAA